MGGVTAAALLHHGGVILTLAQGSARADQAPRAFRPGNSHRWGLGFLQVGARVYWVWLVSSDPVKPTKPSKPGSMNPVAPAVDHHERDSNWCGWQLIGVAAG